MMKNLCLLLPLLVVSYRAQSQESDADLKRMRAQIAIQNFSERGMRLDGSWVGIPLAPSETIGDTYLESNFVPANVMLVEKEKMLKNYLIRYDIYRDEVVFETDNGYRVLPGAKIKSFALFDSITSGYRYFVRGKFLTGNSNEVYDGFFEVLNEGKVSLLKRYSVVLKKADYRADLNVGNRENRILKKHEYFLLQSSNLILLPKSKKKFYAVFEKHTDAIANYAGNNNLDPSQEKELVRIFNFYNTLLD